MNPIFRWAMSDAGKTSGRWTEVGQVEPKRDLALAFETEHRGFSLGDQVARIRDLRVALFPSTDAARDAGERYEVFKRRGWDEELQRFLVHTPWRIACGAGAAKDRIWFHSNEDERGVLMIVDWTQGENLGLNAVLYMD